jgi:MFS family permease
MNTAPYRQVLSAPGLKFLMIVGLLARIPATAAGMAVTLHVLTALGLDFTEAGIAGAVAMVGAGIGSPILGRLVDKIGLRPVFAATAAVQAAYWVIAPQLSYPALVVAALLAGIAGIPIFSVMRQFVAALVPEDQRRPAFALDSMAVELSYMAGPALAVAAVTAVGSRITFYAVGAGMVISAIVIYVLNPPIRSEAEEAVQQTNQVSRRTWLTPGLFALLLATTATTLVLSATELSVVAVLEASGATKWTGLVIALWCVYSLVGGFIYGALNKAVSPLTLIAGLGVLTIPVALVPSPWWLLVFALFPCGVLCAPSLASTVDTMSNWVPATARGEAMGLHGTALTVGIAVGAPFGGFMIDHFGPQWGFFAAGSAGLLIAAIALPFWKPPTPTPATTPESTLPHLAPGTVPAAPTSAPTSHPEPRPLAPTSAP